MDAEKLYFEIKCALDYFGLRFNEKEEMQVRFREGAVVFSHDGREVSVKATGEGG